MRRAQGHLAEHETALSSARARSEISELGRRQQLRIGQGQLAAKSAMVNATPATTPSRTQSDVPMRKRSS